MRISRTKSERFGGCRAAFFLLWWNGDFAGVFAEMRVFSVRFCGEFVVECVVNVVR